jgi:hypothetical protein
MGWSSAADASQHLGAPSSVGGIICPPMPPIGGEQLLFKQVNCSWAMFYFNKYIFFVKIE